MTCFYQRYGFNPKVKTDAEKRIQNTKVSNGMCYSQFSNGVYNEELSITQWSFINDHYKVNGEKLWLS